MRISVASVVLGVIGGCSAYSQSVISAHSGVIHYVEGRVLLGDTPVELKFAQFPDLKENQELRTEEGRAEVLLTPGAFLRIGENSSIRMLSNHLSDTRVEVLSGSALLECTEMLKDNALTLVYNGSTMIVEKAGLYRVDSDPARFRVYEGQAIVKSESGQLTLKAGKETALNGVLAANKFDNKAGDELYRWSSRRAGYVAAANVSAARSAYTSSSSYSGIGAGGWQFNPWFGMYTFVPFGSGVLYSPFGYSYWSPYAAYWYAPSYYYGGGGWRGTGASSGRAAYSSAATRTAGDFSGSSSGRAISGGFGSRDSGGGMPAGGFGNRGGGGGAAMGGGGGGGFGSHGGGASSGAGGGGAHTGGGRGGR